jgi:hypothetical protein
MWAGTKADEGKLAIFKRRILRRIYSFTFNVYLRVFERRKNEDL